MTVVAESETAELRVEFHHDTLNGAIVAALAELSDPVASETADMGTFTNKYAKLSTIAATVRPVLGRHGLAVMQLVRTHDGRLEVETVLMHDGGEAMSSGTLSVSMPNSPQSLGSVVTYFRRYQLCALLGIAPDVDDDDARAASPPASRRRSTTPRESTRRVRPLTDLQRRRIMALFGALGLGGEPNRPARLEYTSNAIGREIDTTNEVTHDEALRLIDTLVADVDEREDAEHGDDGSYQ